MKEIGWAGFYDVVRHKIISVNCPVKKAIHAQLVILADGQPWDSFIDQARRSVPISWGSVSRSFKDNLARGSGAANLTAALYFWLHTTEGLKSYATVVDQTAFGQSFEDEFIDLRLPILRNFGEGEISTMSSRDLPASLPPEELATLREILENADTKEQKYLALIRLTFEIEKIMDSKAARLCGSETIFTFRNALNQSNWLTSDDIEEIKRDSLNWRTRIKDYGSFSKLVDGYNFVLVREDGTRVSSAALHAINSWFSCLWKLLIDEIIEVRDLDVFLRYILVFAQCARSGYLQYYFNDDAGKIDFVILKAIERMHQRELDLRDYSSVDERYKQYFYSISKR